MWIFSIIVFIVFLFIGTGCFGFMELSKDKRIAIIATFIAIIVVIISIILCIKFHNDMNKYKEEAAYTYDLYVQGIDDYEKNKYQEWIDGLGTDEYSAYRQGYSDGEKSKQTDNRELESNNSGNENLSIYRKGYSDGLKDGYDKGTNDIYAEAYNEGYNDAKGSD